METRDFDDPEKNVHYITDVTHKDSRAIMFNTHNIAWQMILPNGIFNSLFYSALAVLQKLYEAAFNT